MATNIIVAKFCADQTRAWTDELWQYDYGQVLKIEGLDLPDAYEVHFGSQPITGETITQIGNSDGVTIPDQFLQSGKVVYAWVYLHAGEDDGETEYMVTIPVAKRAKPTNQTPTPVQQDAITEAIAALNSAVTKAETAIEHYPKIESDYWYVWDVAEGEYVNTGIKAIGEDGTSVTASVSVIPGGHRVTLTDADGEHVFDVMDGVDGVSPEITVEDITGGHRITITDAQGTQTVDVMDGQPGATGNGIASITKTGTVGLVDTYTITYTNGTTTTFTVTNGSDATVTVDDELSSTSENPVQNKVINGAISSLSDDLNELSGSIAPVETSTIATAAHAVGELFMMGETLMVALSAIAVGDTITTEGGSPNAAVTKLTDKLLKDVQVNGTSVVTDGVANVPKMSGSVYGVAKVDYAYGLYMSSDGFIRIGRAYTSEIRPGLSAYVPIVPVNQHEAAFYGLAKASGDTTQSASSNAVGMYTETAKHKINAMLEPQFRVIKTINITEDTSRITVVADDNNNPFELTELVVYASQAVGTGNGAVAIAVNIGSGYPTDTDPFIFVSDGYSTTERYYVAQLSVRGGKFFATASSDNITQRHTQTWLRSTKNAMGIIDCDPITNITIYSPNAYKYSSGTITIYGR